MNIPSLSFRPVRGLLALLALASVTVFSSCDDDDDNTGPAPQNIVQVAQGDARFTTLVAAVVKADLATTLSGTGPFTVFAPTNDAFAKLTGTPFTTAASITAITNPAQIATLRGILLYHVISGDVKAKDIANGPSPVTSLRPAGTVNVNDNKLYLTKNTNGVFINGSTKVIVADIDASNGEVHAIDNVLMPPTQNIAQIVTASTTAATPEFTLLLAALSRSVAKPILDAAASPTANVTVFAPTDAAFRSFLGTTPLANVPDATLLAVLSRHVIVTRRVFSSDLAAGPLETATPNINNTIAASGTGFTIVGASGTPANIVTANILATNGVVHVINQVIRP